MIKWLDSFNRQWGMTFTESANGKMVDWTIFPPQGKYGDTVQMTIEAYKELRIKMCELKVGE